MILDKLFEAFSNGIKKINKKNWRTERVECRSCGNIWTCTFPNVKGGEYKLQCPRCKKRNSCIY